MSDSLRQFRWIPFILAVAGIPSASAQSSKSGSTSLSSVDGQVVDAATNAPVRKAQLTLSLKNKPDAWTATSDGEGRFRFSNIAPGEYRLAAQARGYLILSGSNAPPRLRSNHVLSLAAGVNLDGILVRLRRSAAVSGRIVDPDGDPVEKAKAQLWRISYRHGRRRLLMEDKGSASTDERGVYRISGVVPGRYYLSAHSWEHPDWFPNDARYIRSYYPGTLDLAAASPIELASGAELEDINLKLHEVETVQVSGQVMSLAEAYVILHPASIADINVTTTSIPPDGRFRFDRILPGAYNVRVITRANPSEWTYRPLSVAPAGEQSLTITPNPLLSITGQIRVDGGGGTMDFSKVRIWLTPLFPSTTLEHSKDVSRDGRFQIANLPGGGYRVWCTGIPANFYLKTVRAGGRDWSGRMLDLTSGAPAQLEVLLDPMAATAAGTVFLPGSDQPAQEVTVVLIPQDRERSDDPFAYPKAITEKSGKFAIGNIPPGDYKAIALEEAEEVDPDFLRPLEAKAVAVTLAENGQAGIKLTLIED